MHQTYSYDPFGNLVALDDSRDSLAVSGPLPTDQAANRLDAWWVGYDARGNQTRHRTSTYRYDSLDRLVQRNGTAETYLYAPGGERLFTSRYDGTPPHRRAGIGMRMFGTIR